MALTNIPFTSAEWTPGGHPLERKKTPVDRPVALLEFAPGFEDPNLCERAHVIYVLTGSLEVGLADGEVCVVAEGEACIIDQGTAHRAKNPGPESCTLFVVSEVRVA